MLWKKLHYIHGNILHDLGSICIVDALIIGKCFSLSSMLAATELISILSQRQSLQGYHRESGADVCMNRLCQTLDCASPVINSVLFSAKMQFNCSWLRFTPFQWTSWASGSVVHRSYEEIGEQPLYTAEKDVTIPLHLSHNSIHSYMYGFSPAGLLMNRTPRSRLDGLRPNISSRVMLWYQTYRYHTVCLHYSILSD